MKTNLAAGLRIALAVVVLSNMALAQSPAPPATPQATPTSLLSAKSVFVSNVGADANLFPNPFSGNPNRVYTEFCQNLKSAGQFTLVVDPSQADLVLELHLTSPQSPINPNRHDAPTFLLKAYDRKTHFVVWTVTRPIAFHPSKSQIALSIVDSHAGVSSMQKTYDRSFDETLASVVSDFLQAAGRQAPKTP